MTVVDIINQAKKELGEIERETGIFLTLPLLLQTKMVLQLQNITLQLETLDSMDSSLTAINREGVVTYEGK